MHTEKGDSPHSTARLRLAGKWGQSPTLRKGQALVEVVMATMIAAITTISVFSVVLSCSVSQVKADKREAATFVLKLAQETLKSYVSVAPTDANMIPGVTPAVSGSPVGPGGTGRWAADSSGNWALAAGPHIISSLLNGTVLQDPASSFSYNVANSDCGFGTADSMACKTVVFTLVYPD